MATSSCCGKDEGREPANDFIPTLCLENCQARSFPSPLAKHDTCRGLVISTPRLQCRVVVPGHSEMMSRTIEDRHEERLKIVGAGVAPAPYLHGYLAC